jgi:hypothetical protein
MSVLQSTAAADDKYSQIMDQDGIPVMPDGTVDPAFDPVSGMLESGATQNPNSLVSDRGHVYPTALYLSGLDPDALRGQGKGKSTSPPMRFISK